MPAFSIQDPTMSSPDHVQPSPAYARESPSPSTSSVQSVTPDSIQAQPQSVAEIVDSRYSGYDTVKDLGTAIMDLLPDVSLLMLNDSPDWHRIQDFAKPGQMGFLLDASSRYRLDTAGEARLTGFGLTYDEQPDQSAVCAFSISPSGQVTCSESMTPTTYNQYHSLNKAYGFTAPTVSRLSPGTSDFLQLTLGLKRAVEDHKSKVAGTAQVLHSPGTNSQQTRQGSTSATQPPKDEMLQGEPYYPYLTCLALKFADTHPLLRSPASTLTIPACEAYTEREVHMTAFDSPLTGAKLMTTSNSDKDIYTAFHVLWDMSRGGRTSLFDERPASTSQPFGVLFPADRGARGISEHALLIQDGDKRELYTISTVPVKGPSLEEGGWRIEDWKKDAMREAADTFVQARQLQNVSQDRKM